MSGDLQGTNKYSVYRKIRYDRTYRPLGKMTWWRVVLGLALLLSVFFLSGTVSRSFAARGHWQTAERLLLSKAWMERYRPDLLAFIEAGAAYEEGDYDSACDRLAALDASALDAGLSAEYEALRAQILAHYSGLDSPEARERAELLQSLPGVQAS